MVGFLCLHRIRKLKYEPRNCVKSNNMALLFYGECNKKGIGFSINNELLSHYLEAQSMAVATTEDFVIAFEI